MNAGSYVPVVHGAALDRPDETDTLEAAGRVRQSLMRLGFRSEVVGLDRNLQALPEVARRKPLLLFNLVEAFDGDAALAYLAPQAFHRLGLAYTGAQCRAWQATISKLAAKRTMVAAAIPTPAWSIDGDFLDLTGQVVVKSDSEHSSIGIDSRSVVPTSRAAGEIRARESRFGGRFFAEAYIDGREFNISVIEIEGAPRVLPIAEIDFCRFPADLPRIVDYDAKWTKGSFAYHNTPRRFDFPHGDRALLGRLERLALRVWRCFGLSGYARVDFRVDTEGAPYVLEINVNPCLTPDAGFAAAAAKGGIDYDALIGHIVRASLADRRRAA